MPVPYGCLHGFVWKDGTLKSTGAAWIIQSPSLDTASETTMTTASCGGQSQGANDGYRSGVKAGWENQPWWL